MSQVRGLVVASLFAVVGIAALPGETLAQLPRLEAISQGSDTGIQDLPGVQAQPETIIILEDYSSGPLRRFFTEGEWYFSWGASREWWGRSDFHISQPALNSRFSIYDVKGIDDPRWSSFFGGQYNVRLGRFIDADRTLAVELNFDHTKYETVVGQAARATGTIAGKPVDSSFNIGDGFFRYQLHNGANHFMVNLVKRVPLIGETNESFSVAAIGKVGAGIMLPHTENLLFGFVNNVGPKSWGNAVGFNRGWWQVNGWTAGVEAGFRVVLWAPFYLEFTDKIAFAHLENVPVYQGTARHNLWMNEVVVSVGITFGGGR